MTKYSVSEFANNIRAKHPGAYDDLLDDKLVELWLKKFPDDKNKVANHSKLRKYRYLIFFTSVVLLITGYLSYLDYKYPKSESELKSLLSDKYWKITDATVDEIYIDNKVLAQPTSDTRKIIKRVITDEHADLSYSAFEKQLLEDKEGDCYIYFNKWGYCDYNSISNNSMYRKGYRTGTQDIVYTLNCMEISTADGYYYMRGKKDENRINYYDTTNEIAYEQIVKEHSIKIDYIDSKKLILIHDKTILKDKSIIRIKFKTEHEIYSPLQPVKDFMFREWPAPDFDDL